MCVFQKTLLVPQPQHSNLNVKTLGQSSCRALAASELNKDDHTSNYMTTAQWDNSEATICREHELIAGVGCSNCLFLTREVKDILRITCLKLELSSNVFNFKSEASSPLWSRGSIYRANSFARSHSKCTRSLPSNKHFLRQSSFHAVSDENHRDLTRFARLNENRLSVPAVQSIETAEAGTLSSQVEWLSKFRYQATYVLQKLFSLH
jgi:hypothetical protein